MSADEKAAAVGETPQTDVEVAASHNGPVDTSVPKTWKYRQIRLGPWTLPWYASPQTQLLIVAFVCFLCPGMFNALTGVGGGGQLDHRAADDANMALYSCFAVIGFFAGTFTNVIGVKLALSFGGFGYSVYAASFLCYSHTANYGFTVFAGTLLGVCAALLWTAQGAIMMSYPNEDSKGRFISWFWMIFNLGAVIGSLIPLGQNIHVTEKKTVSDGTYVAFMVLMILGAGLAWTLVDAKNVIRSDGSRVILMKNPTWRTELFGLWETFQTDPYIIFMFPLFFASNWFYTYQFNDVNGTKYNLRTTSLNNTLYWTMQIVGAWVFGYALDMKAFSRPTRARASWIALFTLTMAIWGGGYAFQTTYTRDNVGKLYDWKDDGYVGTMFLYMFYGFYDAAWQTCAYWYMGSLTNNGRKLANFAGFYKGIQSAGAAIVWRLDRLKIPYMNLFASCWALLAGSLVIALPLILLKIKDHVTVEEDIKFSDETVEEVAPRGSVDEEVVKKAP
ncbi:MFS general substrate transporter [Trichodelitschia bisporula]|uniref:MFS general substrate transporter n=1 Tax=Trichodelitschia bisporula TaxID=703511 RepID=A0A6G1HK01_9PEZI|nr:MFS general substrate transporter [Trichodelitschia bisporula]